MIHGRQSPALWNTPAERAHTRERPGEPAPPASCGSAAATVPSCGRSALPRITAIMTWTFPAVGSDYMMDRAWVSSTGSRKGEQMAAESNGTEKTVLKSLGLSGGIYGAVPCAVDVKDGKVIRIRPLHWDSEVRPRDIQRVEDH